MDTAAKTLVRRAYYDEGFLLFGLDRLSLCFFEDSVGSLSVASRFHHCALSSVEFGRGDDLHGFGDFFDVADGFEAAFDFAEGGIAGGIRGDGPVLTYQLNLTEKFLLCLSSLLEIAMDKLAR